MTTPPPPELGNNPYTNPYAAASNPGDEKQWALISHLLSIFFGFIPALVCYLLFRERGPFVRKHTATELNLQITVAIVVAIGLVLLVVGIVASVATAASDPDFSPHLTVLGVLLGYLLIIAVRIVGTIFSIIGAVKANRGEFYQYPIAIRFVK
jgi:uncharacterized Tic20 family protein